MAAMLKTALAAICVFTLLATAFLTASLLVLQPPRANYPIWFTLATIITIQSVATFVAMANPHAWLRILVAAGGAALGTIGVWTVRETLTSSHFEGHALVLGAMLVVQGGLTLVMFLRLQDFRMAGLQS
ncbi:MAG: hypothetical protein DMF96_08090 [Acidobacteria bacterium]|nr:MAG: hypothetical protein DMF96_08090 [Acidobacteriota bacterium]